MEGEETLKEEEETLKEVEEELMEGLMEEEGTLKEVEEELMEGLMEEEGTLKEEGEAVKMEALAVSVAMEHKARWISMEDGMETAVMVVGVVRADTRVVVVVVVVVVPLAEGIMADPMARTRKLTSKHF